MEGVRCETRPFFKYDMVDFNKKIVNSKDRRIKRDYLKNFEFDKEITTHKLSKSILWEII